MNHILKMMVMFIVAVAVYDIYCTVQLHDWIYHVEENPVALWFVAVREVKLFNANPLRDDHSVSFKFRTIDVSRLILVKSIGLACSIPILLHLVDKRSVRIASCVIVPLCGGSMWLLTRLVH